MRVLLGYIPILVAALLVLTAWKEVGSRPNDATAEPFHAVAAEVIAGLPDSFGTWEGADVPVPASALTLLKPNALQCRIFRDRQTGREASLVIIQCRDAGDMGGHYPPICYPSQGWTQAEEPQLLQVALGETPIDIMRYEFRRFHFDRERRITVYNFFAVPGRGLPLDMRTIRSVAADYTSRPFGAAQIQVVIDGRRSADEEREIVEALLSPLEQAVRTLSDPKWKAP